MITKIGTCHKDRAEKFKHWAREDLRSNEAVTITSVDDHDKATVSACIPTKDRRWYVIGLFDGYCKRDQQEGRG